MTRKTVVISAVNLFEGGPLSILQDCLVAAVEQCSDRYDIVALVHDASLLHIDQVQYLEYPKSRRSWLHRLYYEYVAFRGLSRRLAPELWLSLHDITPNVTAMRRAVYCHNPAPFFRLRLRDVFLEPRFALFRWCYAYLYSINIGKNEYVIVQQQWLSEEFQRRFGVKHVIVAHPSVRTGDLSPLAPRAPKGWRFVFPTFPRVFKNVEILGEAARVLESRGRQDIEFVVTFSGTENRYARHIRRKYGDLRGLRLVGHQTRQNVFQLYANSAALVFPSKLETWGMPLSEYKSWRRPILAADLPYARETIGTYAMAKFFPPDDPEALVESVLGVVSGTIEYDQTDEACAANALEGWPALFAALLREG